MTKLIHTYKDNFNLALVHQIVLHVVVTFSMKKLVEFILKTDKIVYNVDTHIRGPDTEFLNSAQSLHHSDIPRLVVVLCLKNILLL